MMSMSRVSLVGSWFLGAVALAGCNAGYAVAADGSTLPEYYSSTVSFQSRTTGQKYTVNTGRTYGEMSFSFDPNAPASATNGGFIPPDTYNVFLTLCTDASHCMPYGNWQGVTIAYNQQCTDSYTNKSTYCNFFKIIRCEMHIDYPKYGSLCTSVTNASGVTTVGVLDGP